MRDQKLKMANQFQKIIIFIMIMMRSVTIQIAKKEKGEKNFLSKKSKIVGY